MKAKTRTNQPVEFQDFDMEGDVSITNGSLEVDGEIKGYDDATFSGDVVARTLQAQQPNWEIDIKSLLNPVVFKNTDQLYAKMVLLGNELSIVISGQFVAQTETNTYKGVISNMDINIPDELAEKIYRADGTTLKENPTSTSGFNPYIVAPLYVRSNPTIGSGTTIVQSTYAKGLSITWYNFGATTEDDVCFVDFRVQLVII